MARKNTFPKGFIDTGASSESTKDHIGRSGYVRHYGTIYVSYMTPEDVYFDTGSFVYRNEDICQYMAKQIKDTMLNYPITGSGYYLVPEGVFGDTGETVKSRTSSFYYYQISIPLRYYWYEKYG